MRTDIYTNELRDINQKFNNLQTDIDSKLTYAINANVGKNVQIEKKKLMTQIVDKGNPGLGPQALNIIRDIEKLTGKKITLLRSVKEDYQDLAERMSEQIDNMTTQLSPDEQALKSDIDAAVLKWNQEIQGFLLLSKKDKDDLAQGLIDKSLTDYNKLGNRAHAVLGDEKFKFEPVFSKTQEVGKIGYAFDHAIKNFGMYQFVVLAGCILLDFVIVIIILLVTKPDSISRNNSVFTTRRSSTTLIPK